jgi:D-arabinose 5-phosphate isomerase GutQ
VTTPPSRREWASDLLDTTGFVQAVSALPASLLAALQVSEARAATLLGASGELDGTGKFSQVVVAGVGPDATVAQMFAAATADTIAVPVVVVGHGALPAFVGPASLVLVAGGATATPETLRSATVAGERGASLVAIAPRASSPRSWTVVAELCTRAPATQTHGAILLSCSSRSMSSASAPACSRASPEP